MGCVSEDFVTEDDFDDIIDDHDFIVIDFFQIMVPGSEQAVMLGQISTISVDSPYVSELL